MTDTIQKLREAVFTVLEGCTLNHDVRKILEAAYYAPEALALPTAVPESLEALSRKLDTQTPDLEVSEMINGLTQSETDASASVSGLTAAPVGEHELPPLPVTSYQLYYQWSDDEDGCGGSEVVDGDAYTADQMRAYARAALSTDDHEQSKPSVEFDLGETSSHTVKCVWSEWDAKANKLVLCLSVRDIETAAPVGEREAFEELIEEFEAAAIDKHDCRNPEYEFEHRAYDTACQRYDEARAALSAGDAVDAQRLDFIEKSARCDPKMDGQHVWWPTSLNKALKGPTLRDAIDAAIRKGQL